MSKHLIQNATIYTGREKIENGYILFGQTIEAVGSMEEVPHGHFEVTDATGKIIIPGMIDVHIHGGYDVDTMDGNPDTLCYLSEQLLQEGVTSFFATTMSQRDELISSAIEASVQAKKLGANIEGIHLEGPFVSKERAGAQPVSHIVSPNLTQMKEWYELGEGLVKLVTFAPEEQQNEELEDFFLEKGIVGSVGHCDATYDYLTRCKVKHYTHLFNQMRGLHHREPGVVGHALLDEDAYVELIADGIHVHPAMIQLTYKLKGSERICMITDSMRAKGLEDGEYELGGQPVSVANNKATLEGGTLAGSVLTMDQAFRNMLQFTGCRIEDVVQMTSVNQAKEFGLHHKGILESGRDADFVVMCSQYQVENTVTNGRLIEVKRK